MDGAIEVGIKTFGKTLNKFVCTSKLSGFEYFVLVIGVVWITKAYILFDLGGSR
jgi:hypothetical protein